MEPARRARLHSTSGGLSETELKELAVRPTSVPSAPRGDDGHAGGEYAQRRAKLDRREEESAPWAAACDGGVMREFSPSGRGLAARRAMDGIIRHPAVCPAWTHRPPSASNCWAPSPRLRRYARSLVFDASAADDLVQTTLERALAHWHQFDQRRDILVWTLAIAQRLHGRAPARQARQLGRRRGRDRRAARRRQRPRPAHGPAGRARQTARRAAPAAAARHPSNSSATPNAPKCCASRWAR